MTQYTASSSRNAQLSQLDLVFLTFLSQSHFTFTFCLPSFLIFIQCNDTKIFRESVWHWSYSYCAAVNVSTKSRILPIQPYSFSSFPALNTRCPSLPAYGSQTWWTETLTIVLSWLWLTGNVCMICFWTCAVIMSVSILRMNMTFLDMQCW